MLPLVATLYNPHTQTKQELIDGFVVRLPLFTYIKTVHDATAYAPYALKNINFDEPLPITKK
jgi:hypothetical protein